MTAQALQFLDAHEAWAHEAMKRSIPIPANADMLEGMQVHQGEPAEGNVPERIQILPNGPKVKGRDGRSFTLDDVKAVMNRFKRNGADLPIDIEHASVFRAPFGLASPAMGWMTDLHVEKNGIFADVEWTPQGAEFVKNREYRYISPVIIHDGTDEKNVLSLHSGALTNTPNLKMKSLNSRGGDEIPAGNTKQEGKKMNEAQLKLLGLDTNATEAQITEALTKLASSSGGTSTPTSAPAPKDFVPRSDYATEVNRANKAEAKLAEKDKAEANAKVDALIKVASSAGTEEHSSKLGPAAAKHCAEHYKEHGGADALEAFLKTQPKIAEVSDLANKETPTATNGALTATESFVAQRMGMTPEQFNGIEPAKK